MAAKTNIIIGGAIAAVIAYLLYQKNSKKVAPTPETSTQTTDDEAAFYEEPHVINQSNNNPAIINTHAGSLTPVNEVVSQPPLAIGNISLEPVIPAIAIPVTSPVMVIPPISTPVITPVYTAPMPANVCPPAPQLLYVYSDAKKDVIIEWDNTNAEQFNSVTKQYSLDGINWSSSTGNAVSPSNMGNEQQYLQNLVYSIKYGGTSGKNNDELYVRVIGNCKNGKSTEPSNVLTYYLSNPLSYYSNQI